VSCESHLPEAAAKTIPEAHLMTMSDRFGMAFWFGDLVPQKITSVPCLVSHAIWRQVTGWLDQLNRGEDVMNWDQIQGDWKQMAGRVKEKWGKLTDNDMTVMSGQREQLVGVLQERYGYEKKRAEKEVRDFTDSLKTP
jgi:uncharacterized protein YjbJ (UPF0337 family)